MATVIRKDERDFQPYPNRIDGFRLLSDISREGSDGSGETAAS